MTVSIQVVPIYLIALIASSARGEAVSVGPLGTSVNAIAFVKANPEVIYAATYSGVYQSIDGGKRWRSRSAGITTPSVSGLAADPVNPSMVYAKTDAVGVFRSDDQGNSWQSINTGLDDLRIFGFAADPVTSGTLYAGTYSRLFKTTDGGAHWRDADNGIPPFSRVIALTINPKHPQILIASTATEGVFKTIDGGRHWARAGVGLRGVAASLTMDPSRPANVYAATSAGVFKSADGAKRWRALNGPVADVLSVVVAPGASDKLYAATFAGTVYASSDAGATWNLVWTNPLHFSASPLVADPTVADAVYAGSQGGMLRTEDGGRSWKFFNAGLPNSWGTVFDLAIEPDEPTRIFAALYEGFFRSDDGGTSWTQLDVGIAEHDYVMSVETAPDALSTVYVGSFLEGVFKTEDGGTTWLAAGRDLSTAMVFDIAVDASNPSRLYAATGQGVLRTDDGGAMWEGPSNGLRDALALGVDVDPRLPQAVYAWTENGLYKSLDRARNFGALTVTPNANGPWTFATTPAAGVAFAAVGSSGDIFRTTDSGASWSLVGRPGEQVNALSAGPNVGEVYAGANDGLFASVDAGGSWRTLARLSVSAVAIGSDPSGHILVGTDGRGVFSIERESCEGDCNDDGFVTVDELVLVVAIALGAEPGIRCTAASDPDGAVTIARIVAGIGRALRGSCVNM